MLRRHRVSLCLVPCVLVAASAAAFAEDLAVPRDYRTVEDALVAAVAGDRVVLRGGTFENIQVKKGGVEILARGATVTGYLWIDASNVTVTGIRLGRNARMVVTGDDVTVTGTKATGRGRRAISVQGGRRATIVRNKMAGTDIEVLMGPDATIEQNRLKDGVIQATDDGVVIDSNVARTIQASGADGSLLDNRCGWLGADGDACDVANNRVSNQIDVVGDSALVTGNDVGGMMWVAGDDAWVSENSLSTGGISVTGDGATVVTNTVEASPLGVGIRGDDFTVSGNDLTAVALPGHDGPAAGFPMCPGIAIVGTESGGTITGNTVTHRTGVGISVHANEVVVSGNDVQGVA